MGEVLKKIFGVFGVYGDRRVASLLFFGFASGLPLALTGATLAAWLTSSGVRLTDIGLASLVGLAYAFKFLWSPLVDRMAIPVLTARLGRRRGWILLSQLGLMGAMLAMATTDPSNSESRYWTIVWALAVAFASATQDIAIDAYRTEILPERQLGAGAANLVFGYRIGMLAAGGGALIAADQIGWGAAYVIMAALMAVGVGAVFVNPEPRQSPVPENPAALPSADWFKRASGWVYSAVCLPFLDFMRRPGWVVILLFVAAYKYGDALLGVMATPFYLQTGFSLTEIGVVTKGFGLVMTLVGAGLGGVAVARWGVVRALLFCGVLQAASNLVFIAQAWVGYSMPMLMVTISVENLTGGMGTTAFVAYLSSLCNIAYTATQYALLSSMTAAARTFFAAGGGWLAERVDWIEYFALTTLAALPGLLLLMWMMRRFPSEPEPSHDSKSADSS
ncbi:MAG: PAT family beta-lactamase induction signal transducer AmpG [Alphaproteobacteria bacterium]|jgi:PAT family beta-lactamase induction signal transducer AmpG